MKDSDQKELKQIYIQTVDDATDREINLIDVALVLVKRKRLIIITIITMIAVASAVIFVKPRQYAYTASIEIGIQIASGDIKPLVTPEVLLAKINNIYTPLALMEQRLSNPDDSAKYHIKASTPKNSLLILLELKGSEDEAKIIKNLLQSVSQQSIQSHRHIYQSIKQYTQSRLDQANAEHRLLKDSRDNETEIAVQLSRIDTYAAQLATLRKTHLILPATKSIEPTGLSRTIMLAISILFSIFLGILSAFIAEFIDKVKENL